MIKESISKLPVAACLCGAHRQARLAILDARLLRTNIVILEPCVPECGAERNYCAVVVGVTALFLGEECFLGERAVFGVVQHQLVF